MFSESFKDVLKNILRDYYIEFRKKYVFPAKA